METIAQETKEIREKFINEGLQELTASDFVNTLDALGYEIESDGTFNYINNLNGYIYKAKSVRIREKDTKLGHCNVDARRDDNFKELQTIRFNSFVFFNNTIWEL